MPVIWNPNNVAVRHTGLSSMKAVEISVSRMVILS